MSENSASSVFDDLLEENRRFSESFVLSGFDGVARAGVAMVTCMDSRIDPLGMIGLQPGDAKILRNPGGHVTDAALVALVVSVHLLGVRRILVVQHTRCAMASASEAELHERITASSGRDSQWMSLSVVQDQEQSVIADVTRVRSHPLIPEQTAIGGFIYDVDSGLLRQVV